MAKTKDKDWEANMAKKASAERAREKSKGGGLGNGISTSKKRFSFGGENMGRKLRGVISDFAYVRTYYGKKYVEGEGSIPTCFAFSEDGEDMAPNKDEVTKRQNKTCEGCPKAEWGSGSGRAQACQDRRRLAFFHEDDIEDADSIAEAAWGQLTLAPTSLKNWAKFLKECEDKLQRPTYGVLVELSFDEDQNYPILCFEVVEKIKDKEVVEALEERRDEIRSELMLPFEGTADEDDEDDDDDDVKPSKKSKKAKKPKDDDDDDEDDEDDDDDGDDEDDDGEKPSKKSKKSKKRKLTKDEDDEDDDEDDEDADDDDDDEDDEDDEEKPAKKGGKKARGGKSRASKDDGDDDDDDDEDDEDDRGSSRRKKGGKEDGKKRKGSRFGKK